MRWVYGITALFLFAGSAAGTGVTGRFTTAVYTFERSYPDTVSRGDLRVYQTARFRVMGLGRSELSFQAYLRASLDLRHRAGNDPQYRFYHGYFRWEEGEDRFVLTGGRQLVLAGVGVGRIDGIRADVDLGGLGRLDAYVGTLVPVDREGVSGWGEGHMFGAHLMSSRLLETTLGVSFYRRSRQARPYLSSSRIAAGLGSLEIKAGEVEQQMVGFDLQRRLGRLLSLYLRWDLSTPGQLQTRRVEGVLRYYYHGFTLSGEVLYRKPYVDRNSIFSLFTHSSNREASFRGNYRFNRFLSLFGEVSKVDYEGDDGYRVNLGANVLNGYAGYIRRRGYGGVADGLTASLRYRVNRKVWLDGGFHLSRFRLYEGEGARSTVVTSTLGVTYRPGRHLSLSLQGQNLMQDLKLATRANPFPGMSHDLRFFFRATTWFFIGPGPGRGAP